MAEKLRRRVRAKLLSGVARAAGVLPPRCVEFALASASPLVAFTRAERTTRENLAHAELVPGRALEDAERDRIARGVRRHGARLVANWLRLARRGAPDDARSAWIDGEVALDPSIEHLERARRDGRGILIVTAHLGDWELLCARLHRLGLRGAVVGFERPNDSTSRWLERMRAGYGVTTLPQHTSARELLRILRGGGTLGLLCDLEVRRLDGAFLPFLGVPALTMTAPAALARAADLPLLPARCTWDGARWNLAFEAPLALDPALDKEAAQLDLLARMNATYERWIRATPEQWAWHQRRWRTRPGEVDALPLVEQRRRERERRLAQGKEVAPRPEASAPDLPRTASDVGARSERDERAARRDDST